MGTPEGPGLPGKERHRSKAAEFVRTGAGILGVGVAAGVILAIVGIVLWRTVLVPNSDRGQCVGADGEVCLSITPQYLEEQSGVELPAGAKVAGSSTAGPMVEALSLGKETGHIEAVVTSDQPIDTGQLDGPFKRESASTQVEKYTGRCQELAPGLQVSEVWRANNQTRWTRAYVCTGTEDAGQHVAVFWLE